jgi:monovalent cation:H+ antiporter, CPA1 family
MVIARLLGNLTSQESALEQAEIVVILLGVTLIVALTSRRLRLPYTLLLVLVGLAIGVLPIFIEIHLDPNMVLFLFLPALLFEGAWNVEIEHLVADWLAVILLAIPGLLLSLALVSVVMHWGIGLPWLLALLLGAMVSPTDPVAVISLLRQLGMADRLRTIVEGESLFNDGVGTAAFQLILLLLLASLGQTAANSDTFALMIILNALWLIFGGLALGLAVGWIFARILRLLDERLIEITVTFSVAYGVYILGEVIHTSGLLAVVGAGLVLGSYGRRIGMSEHTQVGADAVWEFIAYLANSFLFLLVGIEIGETKLTDSLPSIVWALGGVIAGRLLMIYMLIPLHDFVARRLEDRAQRKQKSRRLLPLPQPIPSTWRPLLVLSGLRGALSIALVLSLPTALAQRNLLVDTVFGVVLVTLLGQGLGLRVLLPRWPKEETSA